MRIKIGIIKDKFKSQLLLFILPLTAFAGIMYEGNEYSERDMSFEINGNGKFYYVVSGV